MAADKKADFKAGDAVEWLIPQGKPGAWSRKN